MNAARHVLPSFGGVHLTFDDGPDDRWTPQCLDVLAQAQARATFFAVGVHARRHPDLMRRIAREGHAIGNHTMTHAHPWTLSRRRAEAEVRDGALALADIVGHSPAWFRPPHGAKRQCMLEEARRHGELLAMWDVSAIDWGWLGRAPRIAERLHNVKPGDIVLMHDGANRHNRPDQLLEVLPSLLRRLRASAPST